jgi:hypothetical protein
MQCTIQLDIDFEDMCAIELLLERNIPQLNNQAPKQPYAMLLLKLPRMYPPISEPSFIDGLDRWTLYIIERSKVTPRYLG